MCRCWDKGRSSRTNEIWGHSAMQVKCQGPKFPLCFELRPLKWPRLSPHFPKTSLKRKLMAKSTYTVLIVHTTLSELKMLIETQLTLSAQFIPSIIPHLTHLVHKYLFYTSPQMVSIPTNLSTDLLRSSLVWMGTSSKMPGVNWLPKHLVRLSALDLCSSGSFIHLGRKSLLVKAGNRVQSQSKSTCTCWCV